MISLSINVHVEFFSLFIALIDFYTYIFFQRYENDDLRTRIFEQKNPKPSRKSISIKLPGKSMK